MNTALDDLLDTEQQRPPLYRGRHRARFLRQPVRLAVAAMLALVGIACGATPSTPDAGSRPTWNAPDAPAAETPAAPAVPAGVGDGQHQVGSDIKPGTYTTTVPADTPGCYWARLKDFDGELDSITANGNLDPGAKGRIVVKKSDAGVELTGGCTWKRVK